MAIHGTTGQIIQKEVSSLIFDHDAYIEPLDELRELVSDTVNGCAPCFEMLIGLSRCGKTEVLAALARDYPTSRVNGLLHIPVLVVQVPQGGGTIGLTQAVIEALGQQAKSSAGLSALKKQMYKQLKLVKVQVILFDEASHLIEKGSHVTLRTVSDWFKELQSAAAPIGIIMTGMPHLKLLNKNSQFRNRTHAPLMLAPYRFDDRKQRNTFAGCVNSFWLIFKNKGYTLSVPFNDFVRQCYIVSAGLVGLLDGFFMSLAHTAPEPCEISTKICADACKRLNLPGDGQIAPFSNYPVTNAQLMGILRSELAEHNLRLALRQRDPHEAALTDMGDE